MCLSFSDDGSLLFGLVCMSQDECEAKCFSNRVRTPELESLSSESRLRRGAISTTSAVFLTEISCRLVLERTNKLLLRKNSKTFFDSSFSDVRICCFSSSNMKVHLTFVFMVLDYWTNTVVTDQTTVQLSKKI